MSAATEHRLDEGSRLGVVEDWLRDVAKMGRLADSTAAKVLLRTFEVNGDGVHPESPTPAEVRADIIATGQADAELRSERVRSEEATFLRDARKSAYEQGVRDTEQRMGKATELGAALRAVLDLDVLSEVIIITRRGREALERLRAALREQPGASEAPGCSWLAEGDCLNVTCPVHGLEADPGAWGITSSRQHGMSWPRPASATPASFCENCGEQHRDPAHQCPSDDVRCIQLRERVTDLRSTLAEMTGSRDALLAQNDALLSELRSASASPSIPYTCLECKGGIAHSAFCTRQLPPKKPNDCTFPTCTRERKSFSLFCGDTHDARQATPDAPKAQRASDAEKMRALKATRRGGTPSAKFVAGFHEGWAAADRRGTEGAQRARLDEDGTAKPLTEIVGVYPAGKKNFYSNAEALIARPTKGSDDEERRARRVRKVAGDGAGRDSVGGAVGGDPEALGVGGAGGDGGALPAESQAGVTPNASDAPQWFGVWCEREGTPGFWRWASTLKREVLQTTRTEAERTANVLNERARERTDSPGWRYEARPYTPDAAPTPSAAQGSPANLSDAVLAGLAALCDNVVAPWALVDSENTTTGTIILHDANGVAIADLFTAGAPTDVDRLILVAPTAIKDLVAEVRRLRGRAAPSSGSAPARPIGDAVAAKEWLSQELIAHEWSLPQAALDSIAEDLASMIEDERRDTIEECVEWVRHEEGDGVADDMAAEFAAQKGGHDV